MTDAGWKASEDPSLFDDTSGLDKGEILQFSGSAATVDYAIIHVIWYPENCVQIKVPDLGNGGIQSDEHTLIDMPHRSTGLKIL
jgi:hypothetical protein